MKTSLFRFCGVLLLAAMLAPVCVHARKNPKNPKNNMRLLYWNIQNGMWSGQGDNYDKFVEWVRAYDPDVCVWCEAQSIYKTGTADKMDVRRPLSGRRTGANWPPVTATNTGMWAATATITRRSITSKYPIENVRTYCRLETRQRGDARSGLGAHREERQDGQHRNASHLAAGVCLSRLKTAMRAVPRHGGDKYRRMEMEYICNAYDRYSVPGAEKQFWMMMGDFNARSSPRQLGSTNIPAGDTRFLVHDYILRAHALCGRDRREISRGVQDHDARGRVAHRLRLLHAAALRAHHACRRGRPTPTPSRSVTRPNFRISGTPRTTVRSWWTSI